MRFLAAAAVLLLPLSAIADGIELDSREYKLMLKPGQFSGEHPKQAVKRFTMEELVPAVRAQWSSDAADKLQDDLKRHERIVRFKDSANCLLSRRGFSWRERVDLKEDGTRSDKAEMTLKFRSPDVFLASAISLKARNGSGNDKSKLEEDLSPLAVRNGSAAGVIASPRSARSQFSRSTTVEAAVTEAPINVAGIAALYPSFEDEFRSADPSTPLEPSPEYREVVYKSKKFEAFADLEVQFALTLWYKGAENEESPSLAEISFKFELADGKVPTEAARRALALLLRMQDLAGADAAAPTKAAHVACDASS
jgi:hypothetical protein